jgi:hypothetical protein
VVENSRKTISELQLEMQATMLKYEKVVNEREELKDALEIAR